MRGLRNIYNLGVKELRSLLGDKAMLALIVFAFTISVYSSATVLPGSLHLAPIAIADMDQSQLSNRIVNSFYRPWFLPPEMITATEWMPDWMPDAIPLRSIFRRISSVMCWPDVSLIFRLTSMRRA